MNPSKIIVLLVLCTVWLTTSVWAQEKIGIATFQSDAVGAFPAKWRTWPTQGDQAREVYHVKEDGGNKYLSADDSKDLSTQIFRDFVWDVNSHPLLSWRWRAITVPKGANESSPSTNDSACGVYVMFSKYRGIGLKYVWSSTLPAGTVVTKSLGKMYFIVLDSGAANVGKWRSQTVNIAADYQKAYGQPMPKTIQAVGIGLLTDGNATHSRAACDYDDFSRAKATLPNAQ